MEWEPPEQAWQTYINFELRYKEIDRARSIWQRFLHVHGHDVKQWLRYAKFEERFGNIANARAVSIAYIHAKSVYRLGHMWLCITKFVVKRYSDCDWSLYGCMKDRF